MVTNRNIHAVKTAALDIAKITTGLGPDEASAALTLALAALIYAHGDGTNDGDEIVLERMKGLTRHALALVRAGNALKRT